MVSRIVMGFVASATIAGCLPPAAPATPPRPLKPSDGPKAHVSVDYFGGAYTRQIQARFRVERGAYVVVGHLGGDGEIRILYPETPRASGLVAGGRTMMVRTRPAIYDMSPHLFSFASAPYRNASSMYDSYDGLGHGYVFIIASRSPIDHQALAAGKGFESVTVNDYDTASDLRYAVRQFADEITLGPYTLEYARNPHTSLYAQMTGCPSSWGLFAYTASGLSALDFSPSFFGYPGSTLMSGFAFARYGMGRYCRGTYYAAYSPNEIYRNNSTVYVPPSTPSAPITPQLQRPTRRTIEDHERKPLLSGHSAINRGVTRTRTAEGTPWRPSESRPSYPRAGSDGTRFGSGSTGSGEIYRPTRPLDTPRLTGPAPAPPPTTTSSSGTTTVEGTKADRPPPRP